MSVRTSEMSELLEEMRRLRLDLQRSINKQNELQAKLDENIRSARTPREFTFSGRGVSQPDLRLVGVSGVIGTDNFVLLDDNSTRPLGSSTFDLGTTNHCDSFSFKILHFLETEPISRFSI